MIITSADGGLVLSVSANPKCVLDAIGQVGFPDGYASVRVQVLDSMGNDAGVTPDFATDAGSPDVIPILYLAAVTAYDFVAYGTLLDGGVVESNTQSLTTGPLPPDVPQYSVTGFGADGGIPPEVCPMILMSTIPENAGIGTQYLTVINSSGQAIWYLTLDSGHGNVGDAQQQPDGTYTVASYAPQYPIPGLDESPAVYQQYDVLGNLIASWRSPDQVSTDDHEFRLGDDGTGYLFGFRLQYEDLVDDFDGGGGPDAGVWGCVFEHLAQDGGVLFEWSSFNLPITDLDPAISFSQPPIDAYHCNDIDFFADGGYLLGIRDMSTYVRLSPTGNIDWLLGGPQSNFTFVDDPEGGLTLQHGGRILPNGDLLVFDDGDDHVPPYSRAVEYQLGFGTLSDGGNSATLVWESEADDPHYSSFALGFGQRLSDGDTLVTYGTSKHVQQVEADGGLLWDLRDSSGADFGVYRAYCLDTVY